jgi:hypothetical protein
LEATLTGQLRRIYKDLRYGFVTSGGKDYFFHKEDYLDDWHTLCKYHNDLTPIDLEFKPDRTPKGLRARNVRMSEG